MPEDQERFGRALDRCSKAGLLSAPRRILGELEAAGVAYCLVGGLAASIRGADRLSIGVDIAPGLGPENERRLDDALARVDSKPAARGLLSKLEGFSDVKTPAGLLRIVVQPHGTRGFDRDLRRVSGREHLGIGPYDLVPLTPKTAARQAEELRMGGRGLQPAVARAADLVRMASATVGTRDDRLRELRRLAELEALSPR